MKWSPFYHLLSTECQWIWHSLVPPSQPRPHLHHLNPQIFKNIHILKCSLQFLKKNYLQEKRFLSISIPQQGECQPSFFLTDKLLNQRENAIKLTG